MSDGHPRFGTSQIECSKRKCGWTGTELELADVPDKKFANTTLHVCPKCGCDSYYIIEPKEVTA